MKILTKHHQQTYDAIFQHPIARHLHRRDVTSMLAEVAEAHEEPNGNLKASRNGHSLVLHASRDKNVTASEELMLIRHFLKRSETPIAGTLSEPGHVLVVIDHRDARIYKTDAHGTVPRHIAPADPQGFGRNLHYVQDDSNGQRKPERKSYYEAIAKTLASATHILLFGSATGAASAMQQLLNELKNNHPQLAARVVGTLALDMQHLTEDQLLARARTFYKDLATASP